MTVIFEWFNTEVKIIENLKFSFIDITLSYQAKGIYLCGAPSQEKLYMLYVSGLNTSTFWCGIAAKLKRPMRKDLKPTVLKIIDFLLHI